MLVTLAAIISGRSARPQNRARIGTVGIRDIPDESGMIVAPGLKTGRGLELQDKTNATGQLT